LFDINVASSRLLSTRNGGQTIHEWEPLEISSCKRYEIQIFFSADCTVVRDCIHDNDWRAALLLLLQQEC